jgi:hypothetical protein
MDKIKKNARDNIEILRKQRVDQQDMFRLVGHPLSASNSAAFQARGELPIKLGLQPFCGNNSETEIKQQEMSKSWLTIQSNIVSCLPSPAALFNLAGAILLEGVLSMRHSGVLASVEGSFREGRRADAPGLLLT